MTGFHVGCVLLEIGKSFESEVRKNVHFELGKKYGYSMYELSELISKYKLYKILE